jgi:hypothetical protein
MEVDAAAVRAVSEQASRMAGKMDSQHVAKILLSIAKLCSCRMKRLDKDAAAVQG